MNPLAGQNHPFIWAQFYAIQNISHIPLGNKSKRPIIESWQPYQNNIPTDTERIAWFQQDASKNIGVVCGSVSGNLTILDFDGLGNFEKYLGQEWLSKTLCVQTNRGVHVYLRTKEPTKTQHIKLEEGGGIDIIGEGGYAVAPPSIHESGKQYTVISEGVAIAKLDELPIFKNIKKIERKKVTLKQAVGEGERNTTAFKLALRLAKTKHTKEETMALMSVWNRRCAPPLKVEELLQTIDNAYKYRPENAGIKKYFQDGNFMPKLLGDELIEEFDLISLNGKELYYFEETTGVYNPFEGLARKLAVEKLDIETRRSRTDEVIAYLKSACYKDSKNIEPPTNLLPLQNGVLDLENYELQPHSPKNFFTATLPVALDQNADCPLIDKFLTEVLDEENKQVFYELAGYCLLRKYPIQQAFMFVGEGANGKTTTLRLLEAFLGKDNVSSVTLQDLANGKNRFATASLYKKLANISDDLPANALRATGTFKTLTGEGTITAERKFKDCENFCNYAKLIFSANRVPATNDDTYAFFRRWIILPFNKKFPPGTADTKLIDKITNPNELAGLLNKALDNLTTINERGSFSYSKNADEVREAYIKASDPIMAFNLEVIVESDGFITKDELYRAFVDYCNQSHLPTTDKAVFGRQLQRLRPIVDGQKTVNGRREHIWNGISIVKKGTQGGGLTPVNEY